MLVLWQLLICEEVREIEVEPSVECLINFGIARQVAVRRKAIEYVGRVKVIRPGPRVLDGIRP